MERIILTYGIIAGVIVSAMMWITLGDRKHDFENGVLIGYTTMVNALSAIFFGSAHTGTSTSVAGSPSVGLSSSAYPSPWWPPRCTSLRG